MAMVEIDYFTSEEDLKNAFLDGIETYKNFKPILDSKSTISSLFNGHKITDRGIYAAEVWRVTIESAEPEQLTTLLNEFITFNDGKVPKMNVKAKLQELYKHKHKSSESLASLTTFVYFSILNQACIFRLPIFTYAGNATPTILKFYLKDYFHYCAVPKTDAKHLFDNVKQGLYDLTQKHADDQYLIKKGELSSNPSALSLNQKTSLALVHILNKTTDGKKLASTLFSEEEMDSLNKDIGKLLTRTTPVRSINYKETKTSHDKFLILANNMAYAVQEYVKKFNLKSGNSGAGFNGNTSKSIFSFIDKFSSITPALASDIIKGCSYVMGLFVESKSYGIKNYHGATGQIRAYLLQNIIKNVIASVSKQMSLLESGIYRQKTIYSKGHKGKMIKEEDYRLSLDSYIISFLISYASQLELKNYPMNTGSLGTILKRYADPSTFKSTAPKANQGAIKSWRDDRLTRILD